MASTSEPNTVPLFAPVYIYDIVTRAVDGRMMRVGVRYPCRLDEALFLAEADRSVEVPGHLKGMRTLFSATDSVLWYGHTSLRTDRIVCGTVDIAKGVNQRDHYLAHIGAVERPEPIFWAFEGVDIYGQTVRLPFFGPINGRTGDEGLYEAHGLHFVNGCVINLGQFQTTQFFSLPFAEWSALRFTEEQE